MTVSPIRDVIFFADTLLGLPSPAEGPGPAIGMPQSGTRRRPAAIGEFL
jgi:hypothetical protein